MKITAAVVNAPEPVFSIEELELDEPQATEVLVEIKGAGICHTDLATAMGVFGVPFPCVLGHEGSGVVKKVGAEVTKVAPGDHVALTFNSCNECSACTAGDPAYCLAFMAMNYAGMRMDGSSALSSQDGDEVASNFFGQSSMASHAIAHERNVVKIDKELPIELMGPLGCGIQTGAGAVLNSMDCEPGSSLIVTGGGPVGLAAVMAAAARGLSTIILSEPQAKRREIALKVGATHVHDPATDGALDDFVLEILPEGANYAFDTTGLIPVLNALPPALSYKGRIGFVGVPPDLDHTFDINLVNAMLQGLTVQAIVEGDSDPDVFIPELVELYKAGKLPFDTFTQTFPLNQVNEALEAQHSGEAIKVVLVP